MIITAETTTGLWFAAFLRQQLEFGCRQTLTHSSFTMYLRKETCTENSSRNYITWTHQSLVMGCGTKRMTFDIMWHFMDQLNGLVLNRSFRVGFTVTNVIQFHYVFPTTLTLLKSDSSAAHLIHNQTSYTWWFLTKLKIRPGHFQSPQSLFFAVKLYFPHISLINLSGTCGRAWGRPAECVSSSATMNTTVVG